MLRRAFPQKYLRTNTLHKAKEYMKHHCWWFHSCKYEFLLGQVLLQVKPLDECQTSQVLSDQLILAQVSICN